MKGMRAYIWKCAFSILCLVCSLAAEDLSTRIQHLLREAREAQEQGRLELAAQKYQAILGLSPREAAAYNGLGNLYLMQDRNEDAISALKSAVSIDTTSAPSHALLGMAYYQVGQFRAAQEEFDHALRLRPNDPKTTFFLARTVAQLGNLQDAAELLEKVQHADPQNAEALYTLAYVYAQLADLTFARLQERHPDSYLVDLLAATVAESKQQYGEAIEHYRNAAAKAGTTRGVHYALGNALYLNAQLPEALAEFKRELEIDPKNYMACVQAALILLPTDPDQALNLTTRAERVQPESAPAFLVRGRALLALKKPTEAIADLKRAAALDPQEVTVHFQLATAYRQVGSVRKAEQETETFERLQKASQNISRTDSRC
jgi:tetratricopeptide (TPR) repeat protein